MNKLLKSAVAVALCAIMVTPVALSGCKKDKKKNNDTENRAVVLSTAALDGNFNPFFATSGTDVEIAGQTQIGMLASDTNGEPIAGQDWPTVVLDYKETMYDKNGNVTNSDAMDGRTEYEFVIKNGIKFSDGKDLTIKDVLFNLYVYLDPAYTGSATIYSTDIQGLKAYQAQQPGLADDSDNDFTATYESDATQRIVNIINFVTTDDEDERDALDTPEMRADIEMIKELFREELTTDWNSNAGTLEGYKEEYRFTQDWEIYYYNEGLVSEKTKTNINGALEFEKDENGKYLTNLDDPDNELAEEMEKAMNNETAISEYIAEYGCTREQAQNYIMRDTAIQTVYNTYTLLESGIADILTYWATATTVREKFVAEARTKFFEEQLNGGSLKVSSISGITTYKTTSFSGGKMGEKLEGSHDVLKIVINGVDPKAIWNFAFTVAPMHYYSNEEQCALAEQGKGFGVKFADAKFFDDVLRSSDKNGLPVGAGAYKASHDPSTSTVNRSTFYRNNVVYFERNTYFETVGTGLENAKIKKLNYKVVSDDKIILALKNGEIDYGMPNAKLSNVNEVQGMDGISNKTYYTAGYGYVGINPKYIPDENIRQAIMMAMNTNSIVTNYYSKDLATTLYRPMSNTSWAYPSREKGYNGPYNGETPYYEYVGSQPDGGVSAIKAKVMSEGKWSIGPSGIYQNNKGDKLEFTFTIAGETTDHPAYAMFNRAADILNKCGFKITVKNSITALRDLTTGGLQVWAAAWSTGVDPDMYQTYHKDSTATSVRNWGYPQILQDPDGADYKYESKIVNELSGKIMEARQVLNQTARRNIYAECLDLVMQLAVELPTYQRKDLVAYNSNVIDSNSLNQNPTFNAGVLYKIWELDYV